MKPVRLTAVAIGFLVLTSVGFTQPSGTAIIKAVKARFAVVKDYQSDVSVTLKSPNMCINDMRLTLYYKQPNKIHVEAKEGMAIVPPGNYFGNPVEEIVHGQTPIYMRSEKKFGKDCHVVRINPSGVTMWIEKCNSTIVAVDSIAPYHVKSSWCFTKVDGKYYLPSEIKAEIIVPSRKKSGAVEKMRTTVRFSNYRVNKGIPDRVFEAKPKKK